MNCRELLPLLLVTSLAVALMSCRGGGKTGGTAKPSSKASKTEPTSAEKSTGAASGNKPGRHDQSMVVDGEKRQWVVHVPKSYDGSKAVPLVVMIHGSGTNGDLYYHKTGWVQKADKEGFIAVFPTALKHCFVEDGKRKNNTKWNDGKLASYVCEGQKLRDDVKFIRELLARLKKQFKIDAERVFVSGFSNGANFTWRLVVEMSEQFAAVGVGSGSLQMSAKPKRVIPVYTIAGTKESKDKFGKLGKDPTTIMKGPVGDRARRATAALDLEDDYEFDKQNKVFTFKFTKSKVGKDNVYYLSLLKGMGHLYPNGNNYPLKAPDHFWAFFNGKR